MGKSLDLTGKKFGRLTALEPAGSMKGKRYWYCECECGTWTLNQTADLNNGHAKSCGCLAKELAAQRFTTHGGRSSGTTSTEYNAWIGVKHNSEEPFVESWNDFQQFFKDMGWKPSPDH